MDPQSTSWKSRFLPLIAAAVAAGAAGWRVAATNPTAALATWQILAAPTAPSLPHVFGLTKTENYDGAFNLAIADGPSYRDLDLTVKVKPVAGREDQGGGPIWRCQDENNYICRLNPLEGNFRVCVVAHGKRRQLDNVKVDLSAGRWYEVRVRMVSDRITCCLDGTARVEAPDNTISQAGQVGLWTKADAVTSFDDLLVRTVPEVEQAHAPVSFLPGAASLRPAGTSPGRRRGAAPNPAPALPALRSRTQAGLIAAR